MFGCGCWAQENVAVCTSGVGEYIIKTILAKECASKLLTDPKEELKLSLLRKCFQYNFLGMIYAINFVNQ